MGQGVSAIPHLDELAARLLRSDEGVLEDILRQHGPGVRALLLRRYQLQPLDAEDVLAIALYRLWQARDRYRPERASLQVWFYRIAENVFRDVLRSGWHKARQLEIDITSIEHNLPDASDSASEHEFDPARAARSEALQAIIASLPEVQRRIIWADAQASDGLASGAYLAKELGISMGAVRVYRKRALDTIRREMRKRGHLP